MTTPKNDFVRCPVCSSYGWSSTHRCPPLWDWRCAENFDEDEWAYIRARDPEEAAMKAAEIYDAEDYSLLRGNVVTIMVRDRTTLVVTKWECSAEAVPQYYAREAEE